MEGGERIERRRILLGISTLAAAPLKISARFVDQAGVMHSLQTLAAVYTRVELELTTCGDMDNDIKSLG